MKIKNYPANTKPTHSRGLLVFHHLKDGRVVVQKWPRRRPGILPPKTQQQVALWDMAQEFVRFPEPAEYSIALDLTDGTAFYARDMLISSMYGNWVSWPGWGWRMALAGEIQQALDTISQTIGAMLVRTSGGWQALLPASPGRVLTDQGVGTPPAFLAPAPASGALYGAVPVNIPTITSSGFTTWLNQGTSTIANRSTGVTISPAGVTGLTYRRQPVPASTPYSFKALLLMSATVAQAATMGFGWYDGTNKLELITLNGGGTPGWQVQRWNTPTSFNGNDLGNQVLSQQFLWVRVRDDGTNASFAFSADGDDNNFVTGYSVAKASGWLGAAGYAHLVFGIGGGAGAKGTLGSFVQGA